MSRLRTFAAPIADFVRTMPYGEMFRAEAQPAPPRSVVRTFVSDAFDEAAAAELLDRMRYDPGNVFRLNQNISG